MAIVGSYNKNPNTSITNQSNIAVQNYKPALQKSVGQVISSTSKKGKMFASTWPSYIHNICRKASRVTWQTWTFHLIIYCIYRIEYYEAAWYKELPALPAGHLNPTNLIHKINTKSHYRKSLGTDLLKTFPSTFSLLYASLRWHGRIGPDSFLSFITILAAKIVNSLQQMQMEYAYLL